MRQTASRRGLLKTLGGVLVGATAVSLLPVAAEGGTPRPAEEGSDTDCDYWRYCAIDGFLCSCCGGSANTCSSGTEMSPVTRIGTCHNWADGRNYVISYNDCCGNPAAAPVFASATRVIVLPNDPMKTNDINWCLGTSSMHCSTAVVVGVALRIKMMRGRLALAATALQSLSIGRGRPSDCHQRGSRKVITIKCSVRPPHLDGSGVTGAAT